MTFFKLKTFEAHDRGFAHLLHLTVLNTERITFCIQHLRDIEVFLCHIKRQVQVPQRIVLYRPKISSVYSFWQITNDTSAQSTHTRADVKGLKSVVVLVWLKIITFHSYFSICFFLKRERGISHAGPFIPVGPFFRLTTVR